MPQVKVEFPRSSSPGLLASENGGRLKNAYVRQLGAGARNTLTWPSVPGLREILDVSSYSHCRLLYTVGTTLIAIFDARLFKVTGTPAAPVVTDLGAFPGQGFVTIARNNKAPTPDIVTVDDENGASIISLTTGRASYPDPDVGAPNSVTFQDGYFFFGYGDGSLQASGINDTGINTLDSTKAEAKPDGITRVFQMGDVMYAAGPNSIEVYSNTGNATGFPFTRATVIPRGIASAWAVSGFEDGWSNTIIFAGDDKQVYKLQGSTPVPISTDDVSRNLANTPNPTAIQASVCTSTGHPFWNVTAPDFTWAYDLATEQWHERESYADTRWKGSCAARWQGQWIIGDYKSGKLYAFDETYRREGVDPLVWDVWSVQNAAFPNRAAVSMFEADFAPGSGSAGGQAPTQTNPTVLMRYSDDGGISWSVPVERRLGAQGASTARTSWARCGLTGPRGRQWRLTISDAVTISLMGASMMTEARR